MFHEFQGSECVLRVGLPEPHPVVWTTSLKIVEYYKSLQRFCKFFRAAALPIRKVDSVT